LISASINSAVFWVPSEISWLDNLIILALSQFAQFCQRFLKMFIFIPNHSFAPEVEL
jgi:hypothetical protein